jgi:hypothetical protein
MTRDQIRRDEIRRDEIRRQELSDFLRNRRGRVTPADVGLPATIRRRTPGLRREEVAQLAGMSATWYTWLEQKRPIGCQPACSIIWRACCCSIPPSECSSFSSRFVSRF